MELLFAIEDDRWLDADQYQKSVDRALQLETITVMQLLSIQEESTFQTRRSDDATCAQTNYFRLIATVKGVRGKLGLLPKSIYCPITSAFYHFITNLP